MAKAKKEVKDTESSGNPALDKKKALDTAIAHITKAYGQGTIMPQGRSSC